MAKREPHRLLVAVTLACLAHALLFTLLRLPAEREADRAFQVHLSLVVEAGQRERLHPGEALVEPVGTVDVERRPARRTRSRTKAARPAPPATDLPTKAPNPDPPQPASVSAAPVARPRVDLDPRAVAQAFLRATEPTLDQKARGHPARGDSGSRRSAAMPSMLHAEADGTYSYAGTGFSAKVLADGNLTMQDHHARMGSGGLIFDLTGAAERAAGNDPYRSERTTFLAATREFRESLARRADEQTLLRTLLTVRRKPGLSLALRKTRTFELWDEMAEDEQGQEGRRIVEAFVREHYAEADYSNFNEQELELLNAQRNSRQKFAPYTWTR
jgi:hypothetical protein